MGASRKVRKGKTAPEVHTWLIHGLIVLNRHSLHGDLESHERVGVCSRPKLQHLRHEIAPREARAAAESESIAERQSNARRMPIAKQKEANKQAATKARCQVATQQDRGRALSMVGSQHGKRCAGVRGDISAINFEAVPESMLPRAPEVHRDAAKAAPAAPAALAALATPAAPAAPAASSSGLDELRDQCEEPGGTGDNSKRRRRLEKALKQIAVLKLRRARGATLDRSMEDKIGRESSILAELTQGPTPVPALSCEDFVIVHEALTREEERAARAGAVHQKLSFVVDPGKMPAKTARTTARTAQSADDEHGCVRGAKQRKLDRQRELAWRRDGVDED